MFVGLHVVLAERTETPEIAISEDEGKAFMTAAQNVMRHYSVETTQKTLDTIAFVGTTISIYAPRMAAYSMRKRYEAMQPARRPPPSAPDAGMTQVAPTFDMPEHHYEEGSF